MAFSGGVYTLPSGNPVVTATTITSSWANTTLSDIATALSTCVLKDGTQTLTANIPMSNFKLTGLAAGSTSGDSVRYEQVIGVVTTVGDILYATGAGALTRLGIGTARQQLATNSGATAPEWVASLQSLMTAQGDIVQASAANTPARLGIGASGSFLAVNSSGVALAYQAMATQADQETGTSILAPVTPGRQQYHPSASKAWVNWGVASTIGSSYNVSSITDSGAGDWTVNYTNQFSSTNYAINYTALGAFSTGAGQTLFGTVMVSSQASGNAVVRSASYVGSTNTCALSDNTGNYFVAYGDQP